MTSRKQRLEEIRAEYVRKYNKAKRRGRVKEMEYWNRIITDYEIRISRVPDYD